jgi:hypothetical protein
VKTRSLKSKILDLAQTSIFQVRVRPPEEVLKFLRNTMRGSDLTNDTLDDIYLLCHDAKLPATSLATHDVTDDYQGVTEKLAYRRIYDESIDLTFYVDHNYKVIELFDGWIDYISGLGVTGTRDQYKSVPTPFRFAYPDSYRDNIYLTKFEKDLSRSTSLGYTFIKAYPSSMISIPVTYGASDILRCTVSFTYVRYVRERVMDTAASRGYSTQQLIGRGFITRDNIPAWMNGWSQHDIDMYISAQNNTSASSGSLTEDNFQQFVDGAG